LCSLQSSVVGKRCCFSSDARTYQTITSGVTAGEAGEAAEAGKAATEVWERKPFATAGYT